jgi:hypothetical protein
VLAHGRGRIFLLSPANLGGERAKLILSRSFPATREDAPPGEVPGRIDAPAARLALNPRAEFDLAVRLRGEGAPLGDVYAFISGLYFRGKLAYSKAFAAPPPGAPGSLVITPGRGLVSLETLITIEDLRAIAAVRIDLDDPSYRAPLERDARSLDEAAGPDCRYVLLGSLATPKYTEPLLRVFGERLLFPEEFAGRGGMSRGGLMLRYAHQGLELNYVPAHTSARHGSRPPKLPKWKP